MTTTYNQNVDLIIDQLDAELRRRCPAYYDIHRRAIIAGQPSLRVIALRYIAAIKQVKAENKRKGRATARRIAQERDEFNRWMAESEYLERRFTPPTLDEEGYPIWDFTHPVVEEIPF